MVISDLLQKPTWTRRLPSAGSCSGFSTLSDTGYRQMVYDTARCVELTQADFMAELHPSSHRIFSHEYRSLRPKWKYDATQKKHVLDGYEAVESVGVGVQSAIQRHKTSHTFGKDFWFGSEGDEKMDELVQTHRAYWSMSGMHDAMMSWGKSLYGAADTAIYLYREGNTINYKVFSYENGDIFTETKDENGNDVFVRMFKMNGRETVEIYDDKYISLWVRKEESEDDRYNTFKKIISAVKGVVTEKSADGYVRIKRQPHNMSRRPVVYFRSNDVPWGAGQHLIEHVEDSLSDLAENNKYYAYPILFLAGGVINLPEAKRLGKVIGSKTTDGKAQFLAPPDASNTFKTDLDKTLDLLWEVTSTVVIEPKELKAGENTGAFIKNLYWRELQWASISIAEQRPAFRKIISIFDELVGMIENNDEFNNLKMSFMLEPNVPQNALEEITMIAMAKNAGITSVQTAAEEIAFNNSKEYARLKKESGEKLLSEQQNSALTVGNTGEGANNQSK